MRSHTFTSHTASQPSEVASLELVTVIVPAHNAARTIGETLHSVRAQTYQSLEILVVDDGSVDATPKTVGEHAKADSRVRLIRQTNRGVAAARNRGIAEARGDFIAPIDADDLWCATKIAKQMRAMRDRGPKCGLVYTWSALIDGEGKVILKTEPNEEGEVLARVCLGNLPGNASSALMRKAVVLDLGGYDVSLRAHNAQGCEDWKLYFQIAERNDFAVIREHLTYYRVVAGNMSSDVLQMMRSHDLVASEFRKLHPEYAPQFHEGRDSMLKWLMSRAFSNLSLRATAVLTIRLFEHDCRSAQAFLLTALVRLPSRILSRVFERSVSQFHVNRGRSKRTPQNLIH